MDKASAPSIVAATTAEDTLSSGIVITRHAADGAEVTNFLINNITGGTLFKNDGTTAITNNTTITADEGNDGLKFLPAANANTAEGGSFSFTAKATYNSDGTGAGLPATASITVTAVNDSPSNLVLTATPP